MELVFPYEAFHEPNHRTHRTISRYFHFHHVSHVLVSVCRSVDKLNVAHVHSYAPKITHNESEYQHKEKNIQVYKVQHISQFLRLVCQEMCYNSSS